MPGVNMPARHDRPLIAVLGGGLSGALLALHLLRDWPALPVDVAVIEQRAAVGQGLAYGTADPQHRVNVAATRMTLFAEDPEDFDRWFRASGELAADPAASVPGMGLFPTRAAFARYVASLLAEAAGAASLARLRHVRDAAVAVLPTPEGFRVALAGGPPLDAAAVVLAPGHPPAEPPAALRVLADDEALIADPWAADVAARVQAEARVVIIGTGLTMADVLASLRAGGHRGTIVALSRRGLLPRPRTKLSVRSQDAFTIAPPTSAVSLLHKIRAAIAARAADGRPWEDVIDAVRSRARDLWAALPVAERQRLVRHVQPYWDVHRYQCAPQIDALLTHERATGRLLVHAARLREAVRQPDGSVRLHAQRRDGTAITLDCETVISCTGPAHNRALAVSPVLRGLAAGGLIVADPFGFGIAVDANSRAIGADGRVSRNLFVAGPPARGAWGDLMGLPQVSIQPRQLATYLAGQLLQTQPSSAQEADT